MKAAFVGLLTALPLAVAAAGDPAAGRAAFAACINCHQAGPSARHAFGPQLNGLPGRKAGSLPGYTYSKAMKDSKLVWNEATLAVFLRSPNTVVPGTSMRYWGVGMSERKAADLLAYLATSAKD